MFSLVRVTHLLLSQIHTFITFLVLILTGSAILSSRQPDERYSNLVALNGVMYAAQSIQVVLHFASGIFGGSTYAMSGLDFTGSLSGESAH